ncbi:tetratricopeptide repeat protein [Marinilabilia sp.]|uniref:tetratricopeptide repeat protein n=1 Tax=Marinilabilia sp. TaxID=2021252 RepID=UPI0025B8E16F|nr:tetratricopeptide repeat protein [Marinilabilia sp.]
MRTLLIFLLTLAITTVVQGQSFEQKIALKACEYLDSIDSYKILQDSIQPSIIAAMAEVTKEGTPEERKKINTVEGIRGTLKTAYEILPGYCYTVRRLMIEDKESKFYKRSDNQRANLHFDEGNKFMENGEYKNAIKEFKKAVKNDPQYVFALDHLAISHRRMENFKKAIEYYKKSLEVFPEGNVALLNIAVSYSLVGDDKNSIQSYEQLKFLYPDNPEGYFGLAKMLFITEEYENALDNLFTAHRMYIESQSDYAKDSEKLLSLMFAKLKKLNKTELLNRKANEHNITIE